MTVYNKQDVRQSCQLIADALHAIAGRIQEEKIDWIEVRRNLQRIEDRAVETQQIVTQLNRGSL